MSKAADAGRFARARGVQSTGAMKRCVLLFLWVSGCGGLPAPGTKCTPTGQTSGAFCVPDGGAPAGQALKLEIIDQCQGGCGAELKLTCTATRDGGIITLALGGDVCRPLTPQTCPAVCKLTAFPCDVPALPEGDYTVVSGSEPSKLLQVRDAGTTGCTASPF